MEAAKTSHNSSSLKRDGLGLLNLLYLASGVEQTLGAITRTRKAVIYMAAKTFDEWMDLNEHAIGAGFNEYRACWNAAIEAVEGVRERAPNTASLSCQGCRRLNSVNSTCLVCVRYRGTRTDWHEQA